MCHLLNTIAGHEGPARLEAKRVPKGQEEYSQERVDEGDRRVSAVLSRKTYVSVVRVLGKMGNTSRYSEKMRGMHKIKDKLEKPEMRIYEIRTTASRAGGEIEVQDARHSAYARDWGCPSRQYIKAVITKTGLCPTLNDVITD